MFEQKIKYKIVLVRKEFEGLRIVKIITCKSINALMKINEFTFSLNVEQPTYLHKNFVYYYVNVDTNSQMYFSEKQNGLNPDELDMIVSNNLIRQITAGAMDSTKDKIINMIVGAIMGALIAGMLCMFYMNSKIESIYETINFSPMVGI